MTKRRNDAYEESLRDFSIQIKKHIKEDIKFWNTQDKSQAKIRAMAYSDCIFELRNALEKNGLSLGDVGLTGYEIPQIE